ncbi:MAG: DNA replication and repair protein RecF [Solirubrobacterales bacterium]|nr:DNA replication and repair protein RecF [Solirubrobacterales bacterium]
MRVEEVSLRDFRGYAAAEAAFGDGLTVVCGPNGAGKTNLLEAVYFGCAGRSCRTNNERELVRFGAGGTRVVVRARGEDGPHEFSVALVPGHTKRARVDGVDVERMLDLETRPLVSVFLPDRLELIKGAPSLRRAHLDHFVAALWPARAVARRAYAQTLAQRNALIARIRHEAASPASLGAWNAQLARHGVALMECRRAAVEAIRTPFADLSSALGLGDAVAIEYRPRSSASEPAELAAELEVRTPGDLERGFTGHGPHRDELLALREGRELRAYGSQGQQRLTLLALLLAERETIAAARTAVPLLLLDDVMSELDRTRREALVALLREGHGQSVITTTDLEHVPSSRASGVERVAISGGQVLQSAPGRTRAAGSTHALSGT